MKKISLALTLLFSSCAFAGAELELNKVKLPEAISLIYSEVLKVPYMLDPQLVNDERMDSSQLTAQCQRFPPDSAILTIGAHNVYYVKSYLSDTK